MMLFLLWLWFNHFNCNSYIFKTLQIYRGRVFDHQKTDFRWSPPLKPRQEGWSYFRTAGTERSETSSRLCAVCTSRSRRSSQLQTDPPGGRTAALMRLSPALSAALRSVWRLPSASSPGPRLLSDRRRGSAPDGAFFAVKSSAATRTNSSRNPDNRYGRVQIPHGWFLWQFSAVCAGVYGVYGVYTWRRRGEPPPSLLTVSTRWRTEEEEEEEEIRH